MTTSALQHRALVVDDEPLIRQALVRALRGAGFHCEPAANGREALEWINEFEYDLVVTDVRMPEHNGHALAVDLLALPSRPVIVVLTGILEPRIANDLRVRGVDDVLFKPIDFHFVAKRARELVEAKAAAAKTEDLASPGRETSESATDYAVSSHTGDSPRSQAAREELHDQHTEVHVNTSMSTGNATARRHEVAEQRYGRSEQQRETAEFGRVSAAAVIDLPQGAIAAAAVAPGSSTVKPSADRQTDPITADYQAGARDTHDAIAARIRGLADQLRRPPEAYDGFAIASKNDLSIPEIAAAVMRNPALIHDLLQMTNGILHGMSRVLRDAQTPLASPQQHRAQQSAAPQQAGQQPAAQHSLTLVIIFALGIGLGWLLSWLSPGVWLR